MIGAVSSFLVLGLGIYLLGLGVVSLLRPERARRFLSGFASSASAHYLELLVRLLLGAALIRAAPQMRIPAGVAAFGWVVIGTTVVLLLVPWRWHHRFARWAVPMATRNMTLFAVGPLLGGGLVLCALLG